MNPFRRPAGPCKNADDMRVIVVGIVCSLLIFSFFSVFGETTLAQAIHIDLVLNR